MGVNESTIKNKQNFVCQLHFEESDYNESQYFMSKFPNSQRRLNSEAVPKVNLQSKVTLGIHHDMTLDSEKCKILPSTPKTLDDFSHDFFVVSKKRKASPPKTPTCHFCEKPFKDTLTLGYHISKTHINDMKSRDSRFRKNCATGSVVETTNRYCHFMHFF